MLQRLHLLIVAVQSRQALAARYGARWLLPVIQCGELVRAGPLVAKWCAERGVATDLAGQWLGRLEEHASDWLMVMPTRGEASYDGRDLDWIALDALASGAPVVDYQSWALQRSLERSLLPSVTGPFGTLDWPERVRSWMTNTLKLPALACTPYRTSAYEVVVGFETPDGRAFFKGLAADRVTEPVTTARFAVVVPESFASTLALEHRAEGTTWWLTAECSGRPASDAIRIASALARLQCRLQRVSREIPELARIDLPDDAFSELPQSWIPMDLDPSNVLIDGEQVRFIDLDDSFVGPAPLAMAAFARRCSRDTAAAYRAYEESWSMPPPKLDWRRLEDAALACQARLGWNRVRRSVARGELHADLDVLQDRMRARLARQLQRG